MDRTNKTAQALRIQKRHHRIWRRLVPPATLYARKKWNYTFETFAFEKIEGPILVLPNHACAFDPVLVGIAFGNRPLSFVASEHLLRTPIFGPLLNYLIDIIPHRKGRNELQSVADILRKLKSGASVFLSAEGEQTWDGNTLPIIASTGKLAKKSGATLVTYRLEGAYLSMPRWAGNVRKGRIYGHPVHVYRPEELAEMTVEEIDEAIRRDLDFRIREWQDHQPGGSVSFVSRKGGLAKGLDKALYMCPACHAIGRLSTKGDEIHCTCGFKVRYTETGTFEPEKPFPDIAWWDLWERQAFEEYLRDLGKQPLSQNPMPEASAPDHKELFHDAHANLYRIETDHRETAVAAGRLSVAIEADRGFLFTIGDRSFAMQDITRMTMILSNRIVFTDGADYYEIRTKDTNLRKYVVTWQIVTAAKEE